MISDTTFAESRENMATSTPASSNANAAVP
jgi:hypothetical protein